MVTRASKVLELDLKIEKNLSKNIIRTYIYLQKKSRFVIDRSFQPILQFERIPPFLCTRGNAIPLCRDVSFLDTVSRSTLASLFIVDVDVIEFV